MCIKRFNLHSASCYSECEWNRCFCACAVKFYTHIKFTLLYLLHAGLFFFICLFSSSSDHEIILNTKNMLTLVFVDIFKEEISHFHICGGLAKVSGLLI